MQPIGTVELLVAGGIFYALLFVLAVLHARADIQRRKNKMLRDRLEDVRGGWL